MTAIITDVKYRMSLALIRDLAQAGVRVVACQTEDCRNNPASPALGFSSRWVSEARWLPVERTMDALYALCDEISQREGERPSLLPVGAVTLGALAREQERFSAVCGLHIPAPEQLDLFNSKEAVAALARRLEVPVPRDFTLGDGETVDELAARLPLPCVIKPVCGEKLGLTAALRYAIVTTREDAAHQYARFAALDGRPPIVQEQLVGSGLGCSVLADRGQIVSAICHRRVREYPVTGGPSTCCVTQQRPDLEEYAARLVQETDYHGLAMFEFKEGADGKPRLLEINPRIWGTFPLTRVSHSGIPLLWHTLAWNAGNPGQAVPLPGRQAPLACRMTFSASDLMAARGYRKRGQGRKARSALADLFRPSVRDGLWEWSDPKPGLAYYRSLLHKGN
jgi:predicted ATP-grasp superfamily ATP-dependent carboligase